MNPMFKAITEINLSLLFPKICETCEELLPARDEMGVCQNCVAKVKKISPPFCPACGRTSAAPNKRCGQCHREPFHFERAYAVLYYEGKTRRLLQAFKFRERKRLKKFFTDLLLEFLSNHLDISDFDILVSVPMDAQKENHRGFNQARLLCKQIAKKTSRDDFSACFIKKKSRKTQSLLTRSQRAKNIAGTFFVKKPGAFSGKKILLIDDILTTGFTASECAKTLKKDGAVSVTLLAAARGL